MLQVLGSEYLINFIISTLKIENEEKMFKYYITDSLYYNAQEQRISKRYVDLLTTNQDINEKTGDEIVAEVIKKTGLVII